MRLARHFGCKRPNRSVVRGGSIAAPYPTFATLTAVNAALASAGRAVIALPGDSTTAGVGWSGINSYANSAANNKTRKLKAQLIAAGFNATDDCFSLANKALGDILLVYSGRLARSAGWSYFGGYPTPWGNGVYYSATAGATWTATPLVPIDTVEVFYRQYPGFGHFTVDNGGSPVSVDTNTAGADDIGRSVVTLPRGTGNVVATVTGDSGVVILGLRLYDSTTPRLVIIDNLGNSGFMASGSGDSWSDVSNGGFSPFNGISKLACHAALIDLGLNDAYFGATDAAYKAAMKAIGNKFLASTAPGLAIPPDVRFEVPVDGQGQYAMGTKVQALIDAASEIGIPAPLNLKSLFPYATYSTEFSDQTHPLKALYDRIGEAEAAYL